MFKKYGDPAPIKGFYDDDAVLEICEKCKSPITTVVLDGENNTIACECDETTNDKRVD